MYFKVRDRVFTIDDEYVKYSPYLSTLISTDVNVDTEDSIPIIDADPEHFNEYAKFLQGSDFHMDEEIEALFDYMGHSNKMGYPLDYWRVKLQDNWIRDNFYRLELWVDPYYGLIEIPIVRKLPIPLHPMFVESSDSTRIYAAGGVCLYMAGYTSDFSDVDLFTTSKSEATKYLSFPDNVRYRYSKNCISFWGHDIGIQVSNDHGTDTLSRKKFQFILRLYKSPSEIVHGFDVDCCGILYDGHCLWATKRALYAIQNKVNWFDPSRSSPSYAYRLSKYSIRGFKISLPHFDESLIRYDKIDDMLKRIEKRYFSITPNYESVDIGDINIQDPYNTLMRLAKILKSKKTIKVNDLVTRLDLENNLRKSTSRYGTMIRYIIGDCKSVKDIVPKDPVSILILSKLYSLHTAYWSRSDYDSSVISYDVLNVYGSHPIRKLLPRLQWKEQNPMEQISSTFYPDPIGSEEYQLKEWYLTSPLTSDLPMPWKE